MLHVDYQVRWQNFRGFSDTGWLTIKPLTLIIGANNSGKTSVLAPLLLMAQTMQSRDVTTPLVTRGPLIDMGSFQNILPDHDRNKELTISFKFHVHEKEKGRKLKQIGAYPPGALEFSLRAGKDMHESVLVNYVVYDIYERKFLIRALGASDAYSIRLMPRTEIRLPERRVLRQSRPIHFLFNVTNDLSAFFEPEEKRSKTPDFSEGFSLYLSIVSYVFNFVRSILDDLSYIGPLRERPKHFYEVLPERPRTVGPKGERAANLLRHQLNELQPKINEWSERFELGDALRLNDLSLDLFNIEFFSNGRATNIADAGFGASQVFPLIVQAIASQRDTITIAEQPEIHLNPRLQSVLADLFAEMANTDRRAIVETHSEHLLLRLRRLIAEGVISHEKVALYFVEKHGGESTIREVPIEPNGHITSDEWPRGFFAETLRESLALAAAQSSR